MRQRGGDTMRWKMVQYLFVRSRGIPKRPARRSPILAADASLQQSAIHRHRVECLPEFEGEFLLPIRRESNSPRPHSHLQNIRRELRDTEPISSRRSRMAERLDWRSVRWGLRCDYNPR